MILRADSTRGHFINLLSGLANIALGKMAVQSSTWETNTAELAVDANSNSHLDRTHCSATGSNDLNPWWAVDLAAPHVVTGVKLVLRDSWGLSVSTSLRNR